MAGIAFNACAFAAVSVGDVLSKIAVVLMPTIQVVSVRTAFVLQLMAPWFYYAARQGDPPWRTQRLGLHLARTLVQITSIVTFLTALRYLPISTITSIAFMTPIFVALLARVYLGERMSWSQFGSIGIGFAGCMIILRPGTADFSPYALLALYACLSWAFALVLLRSLTRTESIAKIMFLQNAVIFIAAAALTPSVWVPLEWSTVAIMAASRDADRRSGASARALTVARAATSRRCNTPAFVGYPAGLARVQRMARQPCLARRGPDHRQRLWLMRSQRAP